jgi:hypothetical protein
MRIVSIAGALMAGVLLLPQIAPAQSLGDVANADKERRKKQKPAKVYTEEDLRNAKGKSANVLGGETASDAPAATAPAAAGTDAAKKEKTPDEIRADDQKAWREKITKAREEVTRLQREVDQLTAVLSDPNSPQYGAQRGQATQRLETAKANLATAQASLSGLEDQARRSGYR